ncbi:MAG: LysE family translocator [Flavobacteriales bacterium]|nr:LysE family translocator [Flavobacteriales bacterium]
MLEAVISGVGLGLMLSIFTGPVFLRLIELGVSVGPKRAMALSVGALLSDLLFVGLLMFFLVGISQWMEASSGYFNLIGGSIFVGFGIAKTISAFRKDKSQSDSNRVSSWKKLFAEGFLINTMNPAVIIFWIGAVSLAKTQYMDGTSKVFIYFLACLGTIYFFDSLKAFGSSKLKTILKPVHMQVFKGVVGVIFIFLGLKLLIDII